MEHRAGGETFLEPFYLNERMVRDCAACPFNGYSLESQTRDEAQTERSKPVKAGLAFVNSLIGPAGEGQSRHTEVTEDKSARRFTVGALHTCLVDELRARRTLRPAGADEIEDASCSGASYVELPAILRPVDVSALIDTLRVTAQIVGEVLKTFAGPRLATWHAGQASAAGQGAPSSGSTEALSRPSRGGRARDAKREGQPRDGPQQALSEADRSIEAVETVLRQPRGGLPSLQAGRDSDVVDRQ